MLPGPLCPFTAPSCCSKTWAAGRRDACGPSIPKSSSMSSFRTRGQRHTAHVSERCQRHIVGGWSPRLCSINVRVTKSRNWLKSSPNELLCNEHILTSENSTILSKVQYMYATSSSQLRDACGRVVIQRLVGQITKRDALSRVTLSRGWLTAPDEASGRIIRHMAKQG